MIRTRLLAAAAVAALAWSALMPVAPTAAAGAPGAYRASVVENCFNMTAALCQWAQGQGVQGTFEFGPGGQGGSAHLAVEYLGNPSAGVQIAVLQITKWWTDPGQFGDGVVDGVPDFFVSGTMSVNGGARRPIGLPFVGDCTNMPAGTPCIAGDTGVPAIPGYYHVTSLPTSTFGSPPYGFGGVPLPPGVTIILKVTGYPDAAVGRSQRSARG